MSSSEVRAQLWILGLFPLSEHIAWSSSFPYIYAMVKSFQSSSEENHSTALYASLLVSCFTFGEFLMAPQWARISDNIGRKPTLLLGSLGAICSAAAFGLSTSLPMAFVARFFGGAVNPNLGVLKTYVGELVSKDMQAKGFSSISFMQGLGSICGPVIGGFLAEPTRTMPFLFHGNSMWDKFPYLLPNMVVMVCLSISCLLAFFFLREVHADFRSQKISIRKIFAAVLTCTKYSRSSDVAYSALGSADIELSDDGQDIQSPEPKETFVFRRAFTKQVMLQILSVVLSSFRAIATLSLIPIFLGSPQPADGEFSQRTLGGGFGLDTEKISTILLTQAIASILGQLLIVPRLIERRGALWSFRLALTGCVINYALLPMSLLVPGLAGIFTCTFILWIQALWFGISGTATSMMITNNCPSPVYLATINGVAASAGCLAKTAGPALIGVLYDRGVETGNILIPFWTLSGVALLTLGLTPFLQEQADSEK